MKISPLEEAILTCVCFNAEVTHSAVARSVGSKPHIVQYTIAKFKRAGLLYDFNAIDIGSAGLTCFGVFFSLNLSVSRRDRLVQTFVRHPAVCFLSEFLGNLQFGCGILAEHTWQAHAILSDILQRSGAVLAHKSVATRWRITEIARKVRTHTKKVEKFSLYTPAQRNSEFNDIDWHTLSVLSESPALSLRQLAATTGIAFPTLYSRMQRVRSQGMLLRHMYIFNSNKLGRISAKLIIYTRGVNPGASQKLRSYLFSHQHTHQVVETFGEWEYEANVTCLSTEEVLTMREELSQQFSIYIERIEILLLTRSYKHICFPGANYKNELVRLSSL
jgi:DNA-binding Lrp family transcriptional regulator